MRLLRTNTATRVTVGPFLDKTDGITPKTALTVTAEKLTALVDTGGVPTLVLDTAPTASGGSNDMVHVTGDDAGFYDLELAAADVNYLGRMLLCLNDVATHCPVWHEFMIVPAVVYDAIVLGTDLLDVSVTQWLGTAVVTPNLAGVPIVDSRFVARVFTAAAGASGSVTFDGSASTTADLFRGCILTIIGGTGAGQTGRKVTAYSTGRVATVSPAWITAPDNTSVIVATPGAGPATLPRNRAFTGFMFMMTTTDAAGVSTPAAGKTVTVTRSKDGAAYAAGALSAVTEHPAADGTYIVDIGAADLDCNNMMLKATATGCDVTFERIITTQD